MQTAFDYIDRDTWIHDLHPGTKFLHLVLTLVLIMMPVWPQLAHLWPYAVWLALSAFLWAVAGISLRKFGFLLKVLSGTFVFLIVMQGLMYRGEVSLWVLGDLQIWGGSNLGIVTQEGVFFGVLLSVRVLAALSALPLLVTTTSPSRLMAALNSVRLPRTFTFMFISALSFTSMIFFTWQGIIEAQKLRAFDIDSMGLWKKATRAYIPVLTPLILLLFRKGNDLQIALETKGFGSELPPTEMEILRFTWKDALAAAGFLGVFLLALWVRSVA